MHHICLNCGKECATKDSLKKHMNRKTPCLLKESTENSRFKCTTCNRCFTSNQNLKKHISRTCEIIKNKENREKHPITNMQYQIDILKKDNIEFKNQIDVLKNTVNELKLIILDFKKPEIVYVPKIIENKDIITGIVYLIQPEELLQTNRYKIGCSIKNDLSRLGSYKKKSRYLYIAECINPYTLESNIKSAFNSKYTLIAGREYFEGDEKKIVNDFVKIVNDYNNEVYASSENSEDTEMIDNTEMIENI